MRDRPLPEGRTKGLRSCHIFMFPGITIERSKKIGGQMHGNERVFGLLFTFLLWNHRVRICHGRYVTAKAELS